MESARAAGAAARAAGAQGLRLEWPGRVWRPGEAGAPQSGAGAGADAGTGARTGLFDVTGDGANCLLHGDALELARAMNAQGLGGEVELVYVDPPFASDRDYVAESRLDGPADGRVVRSRAYEDTWSSRAGGVGAYLDMLAPRLEALSGLLSRTGTIWVHLDWRAAYLVRALLDEIMGRDAFLNEIVWRRAPNLGRQATSGQFGRTLDTLVVYGRKDATLRPPTRLEPIEKSAIRYDDEGRPFTSAPRGDYTDASIAKLEKQGRVHRTASGRVYIKYFLVENEDGVLCRERRVDALWTDVPPLRHVAASERTGYPTQKPRALLDRIIRCATEPGAIVVDGFAGSGTTAVAAHAAGRRAFISDRSPVAVATARSRLLREGAGLSIERAPGALEAPASETPEARARVRVETSKGGLRLVEPAEPLAWAVGTMDGDVFRCSWHAERKLGQRAAPATREAPASAVPSRGAAVRVWSDDGGVTTTEVSR